MGIRENLQEAWQLAMARPALAGQIRTYIINGATHDARGIVSTSGDVGLLLQLSPGEEFVPSVKLSPGRGSALEAGVEVLSEGMITVRALVVWCRDRSVRDAFLAFCEALLDRSGNGVSVGRALELCHSEFLRLLSAPSQLDSRVLCGLLGELVVIADLVERDPGVVMCWAAADRERNDFRRGAVALEAKASVRSESSAFIVRISAIDQLQPPEAGRLFLHAIQLERSDAGSISLPSLLLRVRSRLTGAGLEHFDKGVASYARDLSDTRTYSLLARQVYEVSTGFPCLVPDKLASGMLDAGVRRVEYDLDLAAATGFGVPLDDALNALLSEGLGS